jgi:formyl-CoA transferase
MVNMMRNAMGPMYVSGEPVQRTGDAYRGASPSGLHACAPGGPNDYVYILLGNRQHWQGLLRAIEREDLTDDPRYARQSARNARDGELREIVGAWTRQRGKLEAMELISAQGVPCGASLDTCELLENEQLQSSGMVFEQGVPGYGDVRLPGCPIVVDGKRLRPRASPALDADGRALLGDLDE